MSLLDISRAGTVRACKHGMVISANILLLKAAEMFKKKNKARYAFFNLHVPYHGLCSGNM